MAKPHPISWYLSLSLYKMNPKLLSDTFFFRSQTNSALEKRPFLRPIFLHFVKGFLFAWFFLSFIRICSRFFFTFNGFIHFFHFARNSVNQMNVFLFMPNNILTYCTIKLNMIDLIRTEKKKCCYKNSKTQMVLRLREKKKLDTCSDIDECWCHVLHNIQIARVMLSCSHWNNQCPIVRNGHFFFVEIWNFPLPANVVEQNLFEFSAKCLEMNTSNERIFKIYFYNIFSQNLFN